jgi:hypothetical protein
MIPSGRRTSETIVQLVGILILSFLAAFVGLGISYERVLTPRASDGQLALVYGDGWFVDGATIRLPDLASRGNRLILALEKRPGAVEPARIRVHHCDQVVSEFQVQESGEQQVYLTGTCTPRVVKLEVLNPFIPSVNDSRKLGAKLISASVTSKLGLPIVEEGLLASTAGAIALFVLLVWGAIGGGWSVVILPLAVTPLFLMAHDLDLLKLWSLWLFASAAAAGGLLYRSIPNDTEHQTVARFGRVELLLALLITLVAGSLRFYQLDFGLPKQFHPDEVPKVNAIMRMVDNGDLNPRYFLHPTLLLYCTYFVNTVFHFFGMQGEFRDSLALAGRTVSATAGTVSVFLTYAIGKRLISGPAGLLAAAILAVMPLHVTCSRYLKEDILMLAFILGGTAVMLRALQRSTPQLLVGAGLLMGAALSVKYSGLLGVGILVTAPWYASRSLFPDRTFLKWTALALVMVPLGFLLCSPYVVLYSERFLKDFQSEKRHMVRGHGGEITAWSQLWMYHYGRSAPPGASLFVTLAATAGAVILLMKRRVEGLLIVWGIAVFYLPAEWVRAKPAPQPERYIVPCLPFMALAAAAFAQHLVTARRVAMIGLVVAVGLIAAPLTRSLQLASEVDNDTRIQMAKWIRQHVPPGSTIYMDWKPYNPRLPEDRYKVVYLDRATILQQLQLDQLKTLGPGYLSLSSLYYDRFFVQPNTPTMPRLVFRNVFENLPLVHQIAPKYGTYGFHNPTLRLYALTEGDQQKVLSGPK